MIRFRASFVFAYDDISAQDVRKEMAENGETAEDFAVNSLISVGKLIRDTFANLVDENGNPLVRFEYMSNDADVVDESGNSLFTDFQAPLDPPENDFWKICGPIDLDYYE